MFKMKVLLLIDSESGLLENLTEILELSGYEVEVIEEWDKNRSPARLLDGNFIILDASLSRMSQMIYQQLTAFNGNTPYPVLILSSDGLPDRYYPNACSFLAMPFSAEDFLSRVKECTEICTRNGILV
jgi:DNA-binding NtrC family response regulator